MSDRIATDVEVQVLDLTPTINGASAWYTEKHPDKKNVALTLSGGTWGLVETTEGQFVLCDEGVIYEHPVSKEHPFEVEMYAEYEEDGKRAMELVPCMVVKITSIEEEDATVTSTKNLQEFIRTFGSRLEANYNICRKFLEEKVLETA